MTRRSVHGVIVNTAIRYFQTDTFVLTTLPMALCLSFLCMYECVCLRVCMCVCVCVCVCVCMHVYERMPMNLSLYLVFAYFFRSIYLSWFLYFFVRVFLFWLWMSLPAIAYVIHRENYTYQTRSCNFALYMYCVIIVFSFEAGWVGLSGPYNDIYLAFWCLSVVLSSNQMIIVYFAVRLQSIVINPSVSGSCPGNTHNNKTINR